MKYAVFSDDFPIAFYDPELEYNPLPENVVTITDEQ
jgi:hypothetical protein